jgi:hypothetical protein
MVKGLLEEAGIPVFLQSSATRAEGSEMAFGMLARGSGGGPQDVMVPAERAEEAAALIGEASEGES